MRRALGYAVLLAAASSLTVSAPAAAAPPSPGAHERSSTTSGRASGAKPSGDAASSPSTGGRPRCALDDGLAAAAASLLLSGTQPSPGSLAKALHDAGSDLFSVHSLLVTDPGAAQRTAKWLAELDKGADAPLVCGQAEAGDQRLILAAVRGGSLTPVEGDPSRLRVGLAPGFGQPYVVARGADGASVRLAVTPAALTAGIVIPGSVERPALVQLVATGPSGPRPLAERQIGGKAATGWSSFAQSKAIGPSGIPQRVAALRAASDVPALRPNRLLATVAREHAVEVCQTGKVSHLSADGSDPSMRLRDHGIAARVVGETVARSTTIEGAFDAMVDSPSHRMALVDKRFTDFGVGVAEDPAGRRCVVVMLAAWPHAIPTKVGDLTAGH